MRVNFKHLSALLLTATALALSPGCSTEPSGGGSTIPATYDTGSSSDGSAADGSATDGSGADASADDASTVADTQGGGTDAAADVDSGATFPDGFFDEPDTVDAGTLPDTAGPVGPVGDLYAHTATELYKLDLDAKELKLVGTWSFNKKEGKVTDIAIDRFGTLFAITHTDLFQCDRFTAKCTWSVTLPDSYNGLTYVPEGVLSATEEALVGMGEDGSWNHIQIALGKVKIKKIGAYGGGWLSSGDAFSVFGVGTFATLKGKGDTDTLAKIDAKTGKIEKIIGETGAIGLFGLAWWGNVFYGFSKTGEIFTLDVQTGKATKATWLKAPEGVSWWGAGVSTRAAGG